VVAPVLGLLVALWVAPEKILAAVALTLVLSLVLLVLFLVLLV